LPLVRAHLKEPLIECAAMSVPLIEWLDRERRFRVSEAGARVLEEYDGPIGAWDGRRSEPTDC
jgi:hypothetical protein